MEELARHHPNFTVHAGSVLRPVENALTPLAVPPVAEADERRPKPWRKRLRAAA